MLILFMYETYMSFYHNKTLKYIENLQIYAMYKTADIDHPL